MRYTLKTKEQIRRLKMRKINYYYLIAGFLAILFSITHELNGQQTTIPMLSYGGLDVNIITTFKYIWHIITAENLIFGIAFIIMAFYKEIRSVKFTAWLICTILIIRLLVIVSTTIAITGGELHDFAIDIIAIIIYVIIIILGTRTKKQSNS